MFRGAQCGGTVILYAKQTCIIVVALKKALNAHIICTCSLCSLLARVILSVSMCTSYSSSGIHELCNKASRGRRSSTRRIGCWCGLG